MMHEEEIENNVVYPKQWDNGVSTSKPSSQTIPSAAPVNPVNKYLTDIEYYGKVEEKIVVSEDIAKTVGKLEANYEHMREHQQKLEASIEAMPAKIATQLSQELKNQITTLNADMTVKIGKVQSDLEVKIAGFGTKMAEFETKIEKSSKENTRWVIGIILAALFFGISYITNQMDKKIESFVRYNNNIPQAMERANPPIPSNVAPAPSTPQENHTP